jgi:PAS domain S-box-containing protein
MENPHSDSESGISEKSLQSHGIAWFILFIALAVTILVTYNTKQAVEKDALKDFSFECNEIMANMYAGLNSHAQLLRTGAAFFEASDSVSRSDWNTFISHQKIETNLPGVQGVGYAMIISGKALNNHEQHIRSSGFPGYAVKPAGNRETYTSIVYLEPFSGKNIQAFGYDMFSEPIRRAAMEQARDSNYAVLTGKVILLQDADTFNMAGALLYVPIYRRGMPVTTMAERRKAIKGWVFSPYRMNDLVRGILGDFESGQNKMLGLKIYDNDSILTDALLFDSHAGIMDNSDHFQKLKLKLPVIFNGKHWSLLFTQITKLSSFYFHRRVLLIFIVGTAISILIFLLAILLLNSRYREKLTTQLARHLKENLDKHVALYNAIPDPVFVTDSKTGRIEEFNNKASQQYGYTNNEIINLNSSDLSSSLGYSENHKPESELFLHNQYHKRKNGSLFPVEITSSTFNFYNSQKTVAVARDITERKEAEKSLLQSEEIFNQFMLNSPIYVFFKDDQIRSLRLSRNFEQMLGRPLEELLGKTMDELFPSALAKSIVADDLKILNEGKHIEVEEELNGRYYFTIKFPIIIEGKPTYLAGYTMDITDRKLADDLIKATLKEKEILLREVHHRVKNNLQVVSSLLNLQANKITDKALKETLEQSRNRIRSIALVHEKLYQSGNFAEINLKEYTRSLVTELFRMYLADPAKINIRTEIEDINIPLIYAIPCGLIMNEIISNSLKYAFPENQAFKTKPEIFISLKTRPDNYLTLSAGDNGIGLPADYQCTDSSSLGLYLIQILATGQLDGKIDINTENGTNFTITFNPFPK